MRWTAQIATDASGLPRHIGMASTVTSSQCREVSPGAADDGGHDDGDENRTDGTTIDDGYVDDCTALCTTGCEYVAPVSRHLYIVILDDTLMINLTKMELY